MGIHIPSAPVRLPLGLCSLRRAVGRVATAFGCALMMAGPGWAEGLPSVPAGTGTTPTPRAVELYSASPALFVENQGQWEDTSVRFVHNGSGMNVALGATGMQFQLLRAPADEVSTADDILNPLGRFAEGRVPIPEARGFGVGFVGANPVVPVGSQPSDARFNFLLGDPSRHRANVAACKTVSYPGLYAGVDLHTWGLRRQLKYEFHVAPGADYRQVQVRYSGIEGLAIAGDGSLVVSLGDGWAPIMDAKPYVYQDVAGQRVVVDSRYELVDSLTYTFALGSYNDQYTLVIDPALAWSTYLGGTGIEYGNNVAVDAAGNAWVTGQTGSANLPSGTGGFDHTFAGVGPVDGCVAKINADGTLAWTSYVGGTGNDVTTGIAFDADGNALVTGFTASAGWVSGGGMTTYGGVQDGFVLKVTAAGDLLWSTYLGGTSFDSGYGIVAAADGNIWVTGGSSSAGWATGGFDSTKKGKSDAYIALISPTGTLIWASYLGSLQTGSFTTYGDDYAYAIALDAAGDPWITGYTDSGSWSPAVSGGFDTTYNGLKDGFVAKINAADRTLAWTSYLGGTGNDLPRWIAFDQEGNAWVTGYTASTDMPNPKNTFLGYNDIFVTKISPVGPTVLWTAYLGGTGDDAGYGIAIDAGGNAWLAGLTASAGWATGGFDDTLNGGYDICIAKLDTNGNMLWGSYIGGTANQFCYGMALDTVGNAYVMGYGQSGASDWITGGFDSVLDGTSDFIIARITNNTAPTAVDDSYASTRNIALVVPDGTGVLANDTDPEADPLSAVKVTDPLHGTLVLAAGGGFTYTPTPGYVGPDSFTYKANDGLADSNIATVTLTLTNQAPVAVADSYSTPVATALAVTAVVGVLANDSDADGDAITAIKLTDPASGLLFFDPAGGFAYSPNAGFVGSDSFTYKANDGLADSATVTVTITVTNAGPLAVADSYGTTRGVALTVPAAGVLANDSDPEGNPLTAIKVTDPANGIVALSANGGFVYTPNAGFAGGDSFTYKANDGLADSNVVGVTITVANRSPVAAADGYATNRNTPLTILAASGLLLNDSDADGDLLTATNATVPANGAVVLNADGSFTYTPNAGFTGNDSFTYTANDGLADSVPATVTIAVTNRAPVASPDSYPAARDNPLTVAANAGVLVNDSDADGDAITATNASVPANGTVSLGADGGFTYTPNVGFAGIDSFTYTANDGLADSATATVTITVTGPAATLDVDGDADVDGNDALFTYRKIVVYDFNQLYLGGGSPADVVPNPNLLPAGGGTTEQGVLDAITALGGGLDVDADGDVDGNDALFVYRKIVVYDFNQLYLGGGSLTDIVPNNNLLPVGGATAADVKANIDLMMP